MDTTYVNRQNTNEQVLEKANRAIQQQHKDNSKRRRKPRRIKPFDEYYRDMKLKRITRTLQARNSDPIKTSTLNKYGQPIQFDNKRVGRPKNKWAERALQQYWQQHKAQIQHIMTTPAETLDTSNTQHTTSIVKFATHSQ